LSGDLLTTGEHNVFVGRHAGSNTADVDSTVCLGSNAGGSGAMTSAADGAVCIGRNAGGELTIGGGTVAIGNEAANVLTTGAHNTLIGYEAGHDLVSGHNNIFIGYQAGDKSSAVGYAIIIGEEAGGADMESTADGTILMGAYAGNAITSGARNIAIGYQAMDAITQGDDNIAIGIDALGAMGTTNGNDQNLAIGSYALANAGATSGSNVAEANVAIGYSAGVQITSGDNNILIGRQTGSHDVNLTTGSENILIGGYADTSAADSANQIAIGHDVSCTANDAIVIGDAGDHIRCDWGSDATWDKVSDERKKNVSGDSPLGLEFINDLRSVSFTFKAPCEVPKEWSSYNADKKEPRNKKEQHGLLAQDVKKALDNAGVESFSGWSEDPDGCQRVGESAFVYPLIKAVQELSAKVKALEDAQ